MRWRLQSKNRAATDHAFLRCPRCGQLLPTMLTDVLGRPGLPISVEAELIARCPSRGEHS
jgi:hypothetical protein